MKVTATALPDVLLIEPVVHEDARGFFLESFNQKRFDAAIGRSVTFVQDNHSRSLKHVLRGLHYQIRRPQGKLVRVVAGEVFDVAVDLRRGSPSFGKFASDGVVGGQQEAALDSGGFRARLSGAERDSRLPLQDDRLLCAGRRALL